MFFRTYILRIKMLWSKNILFNSTQYNIHFSSLVNKNTNIISPMKKTSVKGIVTYLDENKNGLIDGYINFDKSCKIIYKCKENNIDVGSVVLMDMEKLSVISPWCLKKIEVINSFDSKSSNDLENYVENDHNTSDNLNKNTDAYKSLLDRIKLESSLKKTTNVDIKTLISNNCELLDISIVKDLLPDFDSNVYEEMIYYSIKNRGRDMIPLNMANIKVKDKLFKTMYHSIIEKPLKSCDYLSKMTLWINLMELQRKHETAKYILLNVKLIKFDHAFAVYFSNLNEKDTYLMIGDLVILEINGEVPKQYLGVIDDISNEYVYMQFQSKFIADYNNDKCTITFWYSRFPYHRMYKNIAKIIKSNNSFIFPSEIDNQKSQLNIINSLKLYNKSLNELQKLAVMRIMGDQPFPYILLGPPGTGKTVTLVESILQVYKKDTKNRILVCAPSNSAADWLCLMLVKSGVIDIDDLVRINSCTRINLSESSDKELIPLQILPYCKSISLLGKDETRRITILSFSSNSLYILTQCLFMKEFNYLFIDDAGKVNEPELLVATGQGICQQNISMVLSADPKDLGPDDTSYFDKKLNTSYLKRLLFKCQLYIKEKTTQTNSSSLFNDLLVTQLFHSYRSPPPLLNLTSDMFYGGLLKSCVQETRFTNWKSLPNPLFPFVFHAVKGKESHNKDNLSIYNKPEADAVTEWIKRILEYDDDKGRLDISQITVITSYQAQIDCIRELLKSYLGENLKKLKVLPIEEYEGHENEVVIISTVRSCPDNNITLSKIFSQNKNVNYLSDTQRFNMLISRARSLLIVIGDPLLLQNDDSWKKLIDYVTLNKSYINN